MTEQSENTKINEIERLKKGKESLTNAVIKNLASTQDLLKGKELLTSKLEDQRKKKQKLVDVLKKKNESVLKKIAEVEDKETGENKKKIARKIAKLKNIQKEIDEKLYQQEKLIDTRIALLHNCIEGVDELLEKQEQVKEVPPSSPILSRDPRWRVDSLSKVPIIEEPVDSSTKEGRKSRRSEISSEARPNRRRGGCGAPGP